MRPFKAKLIFILICRGYPTTGYRPQTLIVRRPGAVVREDDAAAPVEEAPAQLEGRAGDDRILIMKKSFITVVNFY